MDRAGTGTSPGAGRAGRVAPRRALLRGERVQIELLPAAGEAVARYGDRTVRIPPGAVDLRNHIERDLRALARAELGPKLRELAERHGLAVAGFSIRDQKSRWGSCSRQGRIALNFRLVQMPPFVSDYVLLHELMHLKQQNHSRRFWRLVEIACPDIRRGRAVVEDGRALAVSRAGQQPDCFGSVQTMRLEGTRCAVRPWRMADADAVVRHANNANVARQLRDRFPALMRANPQAFSRSPPRMRPISRLKWTAKRPGAIGYVVGTECRADTRPRSATG